MVGRCCRGTYRGATIKHFVIEHHCTKEALEERWKSNDRSLVFDLELVSAL